MVEPISKTFTVIQESKEIKPVRPRKVEEVRKDAFAISEEAKAAFQLDKYKRIALGAPDIRFQKIELAKERIRDGFYESQDIMEEVAKKILDENEIARGAILGLV